MIPREELARAYEIRLVTVLTPLAIQLEQHIRDLVTNYPRIDRVAARAKSLQRFLEKAEKTENGALKYPDPLNQIQDQIGARIVTYYLDDVEPISRIVHGYFAPIEERDIVPESVKEFDYEGKHFILFIPKDFITPDTPREHCPLFFELQIKTLFQHAWAEADHDLAYKPPEALSRDQKRKVAFTAAQAWGADLIFRELARELIELDANAA
jgi:putative GTP pyrophosphokinase